MRRAALTLGLLALAVALAGPPSSLASPPPAAFKPTIRYAQVGDVKLALAFPDDTKGKAAEKQVLARIHAAVAAGTMPDDFKASAETVARQTRARTTLWPETR